MQAALAAMRKRERRKSRIMARSQLVSGRQCCPSKVGYTRKQIYASTQWKSPGKEPAV